MSGTNGGLSGYFDNSDKKAFFITLIFCMIWIAFGAMSSELYSDDDLGHFMIARYAYKHPALIIDIWGRPLFTLLYGPGSHFGIMGGRLTSALIGGFVCWFSYLYVKKRGYNRPWLIPVLLAVMPRFSGMCYNLDTGLALCLVLAGALALYAFGKESLSALVISLAPAARPEGILFIGIFAAIFIYRKKWSAVPLLCAGLLVWNVAGFFSSGDPLWLLHNQPWTVPYPFKFGLLHYFQKFTEITGPVHVPLFLAGFVYFVYRWREGDNAVVLASWLSYFIFLVIVVWLGAFSTVGLTRYFNGTAPLVAILSLAGLNWLLDSENSLMDAVTGAILIVAVVYLLANNAFGAITLVVSTAAVVALRLFIIKGGDAGLAARVVLAGFLVVAGISYSRFPAGGYSPGHQSLMDAAKVYSQNSPGQLTLSSDIWFCYFTGKDPYDKTSNMGVTEVNLRSAPVGTIVIWEPHYAGGERYGNVDPERLMSDRNFKFRWMDNQRQLLIFEKVGGPLPDTSKAG